ncbi:YfhO family protein [Lentilactobacillus raoultii]|uniref:YfhO family protein n=1 Tax=Lentilactobacillus raoultii TaxID=1987503 RepID=A0ABW3PTA8_9LACO|nr:YfhO family protein [Lentilactobacillus raoultii]
MTKLWQKTPAWLTYTVLFTVLSGVMAGSLLMTGRSMVWELDGFAQHYPILLQLRHMIATFLANPSQGFTHWSWAISLGSDQLTNLSYYVIGDLFNYLVILFPKNHLELAFEFLIFLRMYASGLAFMLYTSTYRFKKISRVIGALAYAFNGYALSTGLHHPFFILPLIFFPLLCYGIDRILLNKSWLPLALAVFLTLFANFYFAWILAIGAFVYLIIRLLSQRKAEDFQFLKSLGKMMLAVILGLGMSAVVFLPTALFATKSTRIHQAFANGMWFFPPEYYLKMPSAILPTGRAMSFWLVIGISSLSFLGVIYTLKHFKQYWWQNVGLIVALIGILIPAFGAVMNAISTPSNRWFLLANIIFGLATMALVDHLNQLTKNDIAWLTASGLALIVIVWATNGFILNLKAHDAVSYGFLLLTVIALLAIFIFKWRPWIKVSLMLGLFMLNIASNIIGIYSPNASNLAIQQLNRGLATRFSNDYYNGAQKYVKQQPGFFRTSMAPRYHYNQHLQNLANYTNTNTDLSINSGINNTSVYLTLQNGYLGNFSRSIGNSQFSMNTPIAQGDYRTAFNNLLGVRYIFAKANQKKPPMVPYGYHLIKNANGQPKIFQAKARVNAVPAIENMDGTVIYQSNNALPLAYTQFKTFSNKAYQKLDPVNRERVMTQGAVVSDRENQHPLTYNSPSKTLKYQVQINRSTLIDSGKKLTAYRLGVLGDKDQRKIIEQPHAQVSLGANLQKTKDLLATNRLIYENNQYENRNGLKKLTTDVTGKPLQYTLKVNQPKQTKNAELYLVLSGIKQTDGSIAEHNQWTANQFLLQNKLYSRLGKVNAARAHLLKPTFGGYNFDAYTNVFHNGYAQYDNDNLSNYRQINNMVLNLGYSTKSRKQIKLNFNMVKNIKFKSVKLIAMPFNKRYDQQLQKLKQSGLTHLSVKNNRVTGNSHNTQNGTLVTSIPYSSGWKLTIDGKSTPTFVVNQGFVGAKLPARQHRIKLTYTTPGLGISKWISIFSWLIVLLAIGFVGFRQLLPKQRPRPRHSSTQPPSNDQKPLD